MKLITEPIASPEENYKPIRIILECQTEEDAAKLHTIFNHSAITESLRMSDIAYKIRGAIEDANCSPDLANDKWLALRDAIIRRR